RTQFDLFHVADHSYSQLLHALPSERTGVFCHDLDAYASLLGPTSNSAKWRRAMARVQLSGLQRAGVVFYSTEQIRDQIIQHGLVASERLVHAPYGIGPEFFSAEATDDLPPGLPPSRPYLLHVGSAVPRKRLDVLFNVFAMVRKRSPKLMLVQQGAALSANHRK